MPEKLGDVIGAMLADAARARARADLEAVRIAEMYSRDPLLKHLSVPRFRMPDLVVDLPVLVSGVEGAGAGGSVWSAKEPTKTELARALRDGIDRSGLKLTKEQSSAVVEAVASRSKEIFAAEGEAGRTPGTIAADLAGEGVATIRSKLRRDPPEAQLATLSNVTKASLASLLAGKLAPSPATEVVFTSEEIKAHGDSGNVVRLRVTISEDSYEVVEREGDEGYFLSPE